jgi:hypothetical protein
MTPRTVFLATCLGVLCLLPTSCATEQPLRPGDEALAVTAAALGRFGAELPDGYQKYESFKREREFDGSIYINYQFDPPEGGSLSVTSRAELHPSNDDACSSFSAANLGIGIGALGRLKVRELDDVFKYGDKSRFAVIERKGKPVGNLFNMCRSRTTLFVIFVGVYFEERSSWEKLMTPALEALAAFEAEQR